MKLVAYILFKGEEISTKYNWDRQVLMRDYDLMKKCLNLHTTYGYLEKYLVRCIGSDVTSQSPTEFCLRRMRCSALNVTPSYMFLVNPLQYRYESFWLLQEP